MQLEVSLCELSLKVFANFLNEFLGVDVLVSFNTIITG